MTFDSREQKPESPRLQDQQNHLVDRAKSGDQGALEVLWRANRRFVAAVLLAHGAMELEDLLQEVALRFVGQLHTLERGAAFRPWLRTIARNIAHSAHRRAKLRQARSAALPVGELPDPGFDQARRNAPTEARLERLLGIIRGMSVEYREPLLMRSIQGLGQKEIALALDLPVTTVETRLAKARRLLRREMDAYKACDLPRPSDPSSIREPCPLLNGKPSGFKRFE